jgi:hypothetical protein
MKNHDILCPYPGDMYDDYDCQCDLIRRVRKDKQVDKVKAAKPLPYSIMEES